MKYTKYILIVLLGLLTLPSVQAQTGLEEAHIEQVPQENIIDDAAIRERVLKTINQDSKETARRLENRISGLDNEIKKIDEALRETQNADVIITKLRQRVNTLEKIQTAKEDQELNVYSSNFQSAVINLVSMDRELKPLMLINNSRSFFTSLANVSNPEKYPGYRSWFRQFKIYMEKNKKSDAILNVTSKLLKTTGQFAKGATITGALSEGLFLSIDKFINSLNKKDRVLREQSMKMFELTMILSQYTNDQNLIEAGWANIDQELKELRELQLNTQVDIFSFLDIRNEDFDDSFIKQTDALKRLDYLNSLNHKVEDFVTNERLQNNDAWKDQIYYYMTTVQSLKVRFGQVTFKIRENIEKYEKLIHKYEDHDLIGNKVKTLDDKLGDLSSAFDEAFNPQDYITDAARMYKRN